MLLKTMYPGFNKLESLNVSNTGIKIRTVGPPAMNGTRNEVRSDLAHAQLGGTSGVWY